MIDERTDEHANDWYPEPVTQAEREVYAEYGEDGVTTLAQITQARRMLAEAKDLGDIKAIRDMAKVARIAAETVGMSREAVNEAAEIQLRAERMAGAALREMEKAKGHRFAGDSPPESPATSPPRLRDIGITPKQSMHWQAEARVPEHVFNQYISETKAAGAPLQTSGVVQVARQIEKERRAAEPKPEPDLTAVPWAVRCEVGTASALKLPNDSVHLIVTSPPYGLEVPYEGGGEIPSAIWESFMFQWLVEALRVAAPSGRLALNVPLDTTGGGFRPTYAQAVRAATDAGWRYRSTIVWEDNQLGKSTARGSVDSQAAPHVYAPVEMIALFSKGPWARVPPCSPDIEHADWLAWTNGLWRFGGETRSWEGHPAAFPIELPRRLIQLLSFPGDVVLDPFCGSGTTLLAAHQLGRQAIGVERSQDYVQSTLRRLAAPGGGGRPGAVGAAGAGAGVPEPVAGAVLTGGLRGRLDRGAGGAAGAERIQDGRAGAG